MATKPPTSQCFSKYCRFPAWRLEIDSDVTAFSSRGSRGVAVAVAIQDFTWEHGSCGGGPKHPELGCGISLESSVAYIVGYGRPCRVKHPFAWLWILRFRPNVRVWKCGILVYPVEKKIRKTRRCMSSVSITSVCWFVPRMNMKKSKIRSAASATLHSIPMCPKHVQSSTHKQNVFRCNFLRQMVSSWLSLSMFNQWKAGDHILRPNFIYIYIYILHICLDVYINIIYLII